MTSAEQVRALPIAFVAVSVTEAALVRPAGHALVRAIRWAIAAPPATPAM
jgi:hypothetical protein